MNKKINLYGRARRLSLIRNIAVIVGCIVAIVLLLKFIFAGTNTQVVVSEFDKLKKYFLDRGYTCELLSVNGAKCTSNSDYIKTTFYRYDGGFEYVSKTDSYSLYITHRLDKEDRIEFVTTSEAFAGYKNQKFNLDGQLLHASKLQFVHPITKETVKFECPLPEYFEKIIKKLK